MVTHRLHHSLPLLILCRLLAPAHGSAAGEDEPPAPCHCLRDWQLEDTYCGRHWQPDGDGGLWCLAREPHGRKCLLNTTGQRSNTPWYASTTRVQWDGWVSCQEEEVRVRNDYESVGEPMRFNESITSLVVGGEGGVIAVVHGSSASVVQVGWYQRDDVEVMYQTRQELRLPEGCVPVVVAMHGEETLLLLGCGEGGVVVFHAPPRGPALPLLHEIRGARTRVISAAVTNSTALVAFDTKVVVLEFVYTEQKTGAAPPKVVLSRETALPMLFPRGVTGVALRDASRAAVADATGSITLFKRGEEQWVADKDQVLQGALGVGIPAVPPPDSQRDMLRAGHSALVAAVPASPGSAVRGVRWWVRGSRYWWNTADPVAAVSAASFDSFVAMLSPPEPPLPTTLITDLLLTLNVSSVLASHLRGVLNTTYNRPSASWTLTVLSGATLPRVRTRLQISTVEEEVLADHQPEESSSPLEVCWYDGEDDDDMFADSECGPGTACLPLLQGASVYVCRTPDQAAVGVSWRGGLVAAATGSDLGLFASNGSPKAGFGCAAGCGALSRHSDNCPWYSPTGQAGEARCRDGRTVSGYTDAECAPWGLARCPGDAPKMCNDGGCRGSCDMHGGERVCHGDGVRVVPGAASCPPGYASPASREDCAAAAGVLNATVTEEGSEAPTGCHVLAGEVVVWSAPPGPPPYPSHLPPAVPRNLSRELLSSFPSYDDWLSPAACAAACSAARTVAQEACVSAFHQPELQVCVLLTRVPTEEESEDDSVSGSYFEGLPQEEEQEAPPQEGPPPPSGAVVCREDPWVLLGVPSSTCEVNGLHSITSHLECQQAVELLYRRQRLPDVVPIIASPIPEDRRDPGCRLLSGTFTFNPYSKGYDAYDTSPYVRFVCAVKPPVVAGHPPHFSVPPPPSEVPPRYPHTITASLFYFPMWMYVILIAGTVMGLLAVAAFFSPHGRYSARRNRRRRAAAWGDREPGLSAELIETRKQRYDELLISYQTDIDPDTTVVACTVCLEDMVDSCVQLPCGHRLHLKCMQQYVTHLVVKGRKKLARCPNCRTELELPEEGEGGTRRNTGEEGYLEGTDSADEQLLNPLRPRSFGEALIDDPAD